MKLNYLIMIIALAPILVTGCAAVTCDPSPYTPPARYPNYTDDKTDNTHYYRLYCNQGFFTNTGQGY